MINEIRLERYKKLHKEEHHNCNHCEGLENCKNNMRGYVETLSNPYGDGTPCMLSERCELEYERVKKIKLKDSIQESDLGEKSENQTLDNFDFSQNSEAYKIITDYVNNFSRTSSDGLFLMGAVGTGKSHLANGIYKALSEKDIKVHLKSFIKFNVLISTAWEKKDSREVIESMLKPEVLVLDGFGRGNISPKVKTAISDIIDYRYDNNMPTIYTSTLNRKMIEALFDDALLSRIYGTCKFVKINGGDYRIKNQAS